MAKIRYNGIKFKKYQYNGSNGGIWSENILWQKLIEPIEKRSPNNKVYKNLRKQTIRSNFLVH